MLIYPYLGSARIFLKMFFSLLPLAPHCGADGDAE